MRDLCCSCVVQTYLGPRRFRVHSFRELKGLVWGGGISGARIWCLGLTMSGKGLLLIHFRALLESCCLPCRQWGTEVAVVSMPRNQPKKQVVKTAAIISMDLRRDP